MPADNPVVVNNKRINEKYVGGLSGEGTPGSIPNPEVKLTSADGTAWATVWESMPLPT